MMQKGPKRGGKASLGREVGLSQRTEVAAVFEQRWEVCGAFKVSINLLSAWACTEQQLWQQHPAHHHKGHCPAMASAIFGPDTQFPEVLLWPLCTGTGSIQDQFNAIDFRINCQGAEISHVYCSSILTTHSPLMKHSSQM